MPLPFSEACERNKQPIVEALREILIEPGLVLEVGAGTGQHAVHFARELPHLTWQPSDLADNLPAIEARRREAGLDNLLPPIELDAAAGPWPADPLAAIFAANVTHIMSWSGVQALFAAAARLLAGGPLVIYGPFNHAGAFTSPGNRALDEWARTTFPGGGLRDRQAVEALADAHGMVIRPVRQLPANNLLLQFDVVEDER